MPDPLEVLAGRLREQLLRDAGDPDALADPDLVAQIRALVDREAATLGPDARAELVRRVAERSFGLGPLEPLLADPRSTRSSSTTKPRVGGGLSLGLTCFRTNG